MKFNDTVLPKLEPSVARMQRGWSGMTEKLPSGIGGGKIAAVIAGVGLLGGAAYLATRKKPDTTSWTDRVNAERAAQTQNTSPQR